ncbi:hypothetical protein [Methanospirillum hungatei]|jgi:hypothetical protein|uniref:hypothetical protein n=1 Tax=Methanospirillum hungatei TaxID=2203 RepID=UPI00064F0448|nr:hypothetical protein [Methanospirillum hungatei]
MAETLGSLCDKLTIVKLKQYHTQDSNRLKSLSIQERQLCEEIDGFIYSAINGDICPEKLTFTSNKVYKLEGNEIDEISGTIGNIFSLLASVNCQLWHEQEKVYDFENIHPNEKNTVVKQLAILNLQRNQCIDEIDKNFQQIIIKLRNGYKK